MKKLLMFTIYMSLISFFAVAQNVYQINTDLANWGVSTTQAGPYNLPPIEVTGGCLNADIIACLCGGTGQEAPTVGTCAAAMEIWGHDWECVNNLPCTYAPATYWFQRVIPMSDCERPAAFTIDVQGDNNMTLYINNTIVLTTTSGQWSQNFNSANNAAFQTAINNAIANIAPGTDITIRARVQNTSGAPCINYAFFSMCGTLTTQAVNLNPTSVNVSTNSTTNTVVATATGIPTNPGVSVLWTVQSRLTGSGNAYTTVLTQSGGSTLTFTSTPCYDYVISLAITWGDCMGGWKGSFSVLCKGLTGDGGGKRLIEPTVTEMPFDAAEMKEMLAQYKAANEISLLEKITLSPNPASRTFSINLGEVEAEEIHIFNTTSDLVYVINPEGRKQIQDIDITSLSAGLYFVVVKDKAGNTHTEKLQVQ